MIDAKYIFAKGYKILEYFSTYGAARMIYFCLRIKMATHCPLFASMQKLRVGIFSHLPMSNDGYIYDHRPPEMA